MLTKYTTFIISAITLVSATSAIAASSAYCFDAGMAGCASEEAAVMTNENQPLQVAQQAATDDGRQLIVQFDADLSQPQITEILDRLGTKQINTIKGDHLVLVEVPFVGVMTDIQTALNATEGVVFAEPNAEMSIPKQPNADGTTSPPADAPLIELPKIK